MQRSAVHLLVFRENMLIRLRWKLRNPLRRSSFNKRLVSNYIALYKLFALLTLGTSEEPLAVRFNDPPDRLSDTVDSFNSRRDIPKNGEIAVERANKSEKLSLPSREKQLQNKALSWSIMKFPKIAFRCSAINKFSIKLHEKFVSASSTDKASLSLCCRRHSCAGPPENIKIFIHHKIDYEMNARNRRRRKRAEPERGEMRNSPRK